MDRWDIGVDLLLLKKNTFQRNILKNIYFNTHI